MMFNNIQDKKIRTFLIVWFAITVLITIIAGTAMLGFYDVNVTNIKAEEIQSSPQLANAVQQWREQGATDQQIKQQIDQIAMGQAAPAISVMKKSSFRAAAITIIAFLLFYFLFSGKKTSNRRGNPPTHSRCKTGMFHFKKGGVSFAFAIIGLLLIDQIYIAQKYVMKEPVEITLQKPDAIAKLQTAQQPFRVAVIDKGTYNIWVTSLFQLHGVECIDVPADSRPTPLRKIFFYSDAISPVRRWEYSNVKYILGPQRGIEMFLRRMGARKQFTSYYTYNLNNQQHAIYEFKNTLPRVYTVGEWSVITNANAAIAFMNNPKTDPHKIAVITDTEISETLNTNFTGSVDIKSYTPVKIETVVNLSATGLVAMATESDGNWKIYVDGRLVESIGCNLLHFGTFVPEGKHLVTFSYDKKLTTVSRITSVAYLFLQVLLLLTIIVFLIKRR